MVVTGSETLVVATANTFESRLIDRSDGLKPFVERCVGVLLLQELLGKTEEQAEDRLSEDGFNLVSFDSEMGLAIAVSNELFDRSTVDSKIKLQINTPSVVESTLKVFNTGSRRLRIRGLMAVRLALNNTDPIYIANTHPIVFLRAISRNQQISAISSALNTQTFAETSLIVGGDFNHYPGPRPIDLAMQTSLKLGRVNLDRKTWPVRGSKHEWIARLGSLANRDVDSFDADLDAILFRGVTELNTSVIDIESDHRAVVSEFTV